MSDGSGYFPAWDDEDHENYRTGAGAKEQHPFWQNVVSAVKRGVRGYAEIINDLYDRAVQQKGPDITIQEVREEPWKFADEEEFRELAAKGFGDVPNKVGDRGDSGLEGEPPSETSYEQMLSTDTQLANADQEQRDIRNPSFLDTEGNGEELESALDEEGNPQTAGISYESAPKESSREVSEIGALTYQGAEDAFGSEEAVRSIQTDLKDMGYDLGTFGPNEDGVDGDYGKTTTQAVREFQKDAGLEPTGNVDQRTWDALIRERDNTSAGAR